MVTLALVFEYAALGSIDKLFDNSEAILTWSWDGRLVNMIEIAGALKYLHRLQKDPVYHRDVKAEIVNLDII